MYLAPSFTLALFNTGGRRMGSASWSDYDYGVEMEISGIRNFLNMMLVVAAMCIYVGSLNVSDFAKKCMLSAWEIIKALPSAIRVFVVGAIEGMPLSERSDDPN